MVELARHRCRREGSGRLGRESSAAEAQRPCQGEYVGRMSRGYFDAASGQPLHPAASEALSAFADSSWADPHLTHHEGRSAAQLLEAARQTVAAILEVSPGEVTFQRDGFAAAFAAIGAVTAASPNNAHSPILVTAVERSAVLAAADGASTGSKAARIPVSETGAVSVADLKAMIDDDRPDAVCVQAANVELGTRQPLTTVSGICESAMVPLVVDATGSLGYVTVDPGWSALFADAYSWAGPRGVALLAVREGPPWRSPGHGRGLARPADIDDVAAAVGAAAALDALHRQRTTEVARLWGLVSRIRAEVSASIPDVQLLGEEANRLPHTVTFSCLYADGEQLAAELDRQGFAVGSGSACASRTGLPSHVLAAIGSLTHGNVRVSLPIGCSEESVEQFLAVLPAAVADVRSDAGAPA